MKSCFLSSAMACTDNAVKVVNSYQRQHCHIQMMIPFWKVIQRFLCRTCRHQPQIRRSSIDMESWRHRVLHRLPPDESGRSTCEIRVLRVWKRSVYKSPIRQMIRHKPILLNLFPTNHQRLRYLRQIIKHYIMWIAK